MLRRAQQQQRADPCFDMDLSPLDCGCERYRAVGVRMKGHPDVVLSDAGFRIDTAWETALPESAQTHIIETAPGPTLTRSRRLIEWHGHCKLLGNDVVEIELVSPSNRALSANIPANLTV